MKFVNLLHAGFPEVEPFSSWDQSYWRIRR